MGSFNVGCGLSNIGINVGDEAGIVLLSPSTQKDLNSSFYIYTYDKFQLMSSPIFGSYDDYGNVVNIAKSPMTDFLEARFGKPIDVIVNCVSNEGREVYNRFGPIFSSFSNTIKQDWDISQSEYLMAIGFTVNGTTATFQDWEVNFENSRKWEFTNSKNNITLNFFGSEDKIMSQFAQKTKVYPGFEESDWDTIRELCSMSKMFIHKGIYDEFKANFELEEYRTSALDYKMENLTRNIKQAKKDPEMRMLISGVTEFYQIGLFVDDYFAMYNMGCLDEIVNMVNFSSMMTSVNRMLQPSYCGEQFGNDDAMRKLLDAVGRVVDERIAEYEDYDEDYEDDI